MSVLSLIKPIIGKPDLTEDVKIVNAFTAIENWANGQIDSSNIAAEGIDEGSLATALRELLHSKAGPLSILTSMLGELAVTTEKIAALAVTTAKIAEGAITDAKITANRILMNTGNGYSESETARSCGEVISPKATRPLWVQAEPGVVASAEGAYGVFKLFVNGFQQGQCRWKADGAENARVPFPFLLPVEATYEFTCEATGGGTVVSTSLRTSYLEF